jgi:hypothetical protein
VLGCALTVGLVTAVLAALWHPVAAAAGVTGFWLVWTAYAAAHDGSGLFVIGSVLLAAGLTGGTAVAAALGAGVSTFAARRRHTARDASGEPETSGS